MTPEPAFMASARQAQSWLLKLRWFWLLGMLCSLLSTALAQPAVPALNARVIDTAAVLTAQEAANLEAKLADFEKHSGSQVVVLLVPSTLPEDIASYANRVADAWKIGRRDVGDGVLLLVAVQDRKLRIEVAKTLEGAIPDLAAKRVIDQAITPQFKQGAYAAGIDAGLNQLFALIRGEHLPAPTGHQSADGGFDWMELGVFMFMAIPVVGALTRQILGSRLGAIVTGLVAGGIAHLLTASWVISVLAGLLGLVISLFGKVTVGKQHAGWRSGTGGFQGPHTGGFGGGFSGGGGGGGFSSGGGGDFGGGGASGDW